MVQKNRSFPAISHLFMTVLSVVSILPFWLMIASSLTDEKSLIVNGYSFIPSGVSLQAYRYLFDDGITMFRAYGITIFVTVVGTTLSLVLTTMLSYALSKRDLPGRVAISFYIFFAMLFNGGIVPTYIMWTNTFHITNTLWALILPNYVVMAFYVIMMRTYFQTNIPEAVLESAQIDGAKEMRTLVRIVLPMATPIIATVGMMVMITYWNDWMNGLYYVNDTKLFSIQLILNKMIQNAEAIRTMNTGTNIPLPSTAVRMAVAVLGSLPLMCVFPFFQKYYVKGITIGAVKG